MGLRYYRKMCISWVVESGCRLKAVPRWNRLQTTKKKQKKNLLISNETIHLQNKCAFWNVMVVAMRHKFYFEDSERSPFLFFRSCLVSCLRVFADKAGCSMQNTSRCSNLLTGKVQSNRKKVLGCGIRHLCEKIPATASNHLPTSHSNQWLLGCYSLVCMTGTLAINFTAASVSPFPPGGGIHIFSRNLWLLLTSL